MTHRLTITIFLVISTAAAGIAQKQLKPWKEWSKTDAQKILNDSPWAHPQTDMELTDPNQLNRSRVVGTGDEEVRTRMNAERVTYSIRFLSARPIRQAFIRILQLQKTDLSAETMSRLDAFAERPSEDLIVVAVGVDGPDTKPIQKVMQVLRTASTGTLRSSTYLERSDGERIYLQEYAPPGKDGFGARFIFPRMLKGQPFIGAESSAVRFVSTLNNEIKFNMTYKVKDMMLDGKLEY